jgi:hypothetical protein
MAKAEKTREVRSRHFPHRLEFILQKGQPEPSLTKAQERRLIAIGSFGWRLLRARKRVSLAKKISDGVRDEILKRLPTSIYGVRIYSRRSMQVLASTTHFEQPVSAVDFIKFLGAYAPTVVSGIKLPLDQLLSQPANYAKLVAALLEVFGDEFADEVGITYNKGVFWELVNDGDLPQPPESMFEKVPSDSRRVLVERIDNRPEPVNASEPTTSPAPNAAPELAQDADGPRDPMSEWDRPEDDGIDPRQGSLGRGC